MGKAEWRQGGLESGHEGLNCLASVKTEPSEEQDSRGCRGSLAILAILICLILFQPGQTLPCLQIPGTSSQPHVAPFLLPNAVSLKSKYLITQK